VLRVLAVAHGARHLLLLLVVHLGVHVAVAAAARKLPETQRRIVAGVLSPQPGTARGRGKGEGQGQGGRVLFVFG